MKDCSASPAHLPRRFSHGHAHFGACRVEGDFESAAAFSFTEVPVAASWDRLEGPRRADIQSVAGGQSADSSFDLIEIHAGWKPKSYFSHVGMSRLERRRAQHALRLGVGLVLTLLFSR